MDQYSNGNKQKNKISLKACSDFIERHYIAFLLAVVVALVAYGIYNHFNPGAEITGDYLRRPYSELLRSLDEAPEDISSKNYKSVIPKIVQKDIQKMLASNGELSILYYGKQSSIQIEEDDEGMVLTICKKNDYYSHEIKMIDNISMYKSGDSILIYGSKNYARRYLDCYEVNEKSVIRVSLENEYIDLYGAGIEYDEVRALEKEISLVNRGKDFMFYRLGKQVGKTERFPGGEITKYDYHYILDDNNDLYYLYYCAHPSNTWIKFIKVDSNISGITEEFMQSLDSRVKYPIYVKNGERYAGISNVDTEGAYGNNYGANYDTLDVSTFDFSITTVELKKDISSIILNRREADSFLHSEEYDWYIRYNYANETAYIEERINGLDSFLTTIIPEDEMKKYDGKKIKSDQLTDVIAELKQLYDKFS